MQIPVTGRTPTENETKLPVNTAAKIQLQYQSIAFISVFWYENKFSLDKYDRPFFFILGCKLDLCRGLE